MNARAVVLSTTLITHAVRNGFSDPPALSQPRRYCHHMHNIARLKSWRSPDTRAFSWLFDCSVFPIVDVFDDGDDNYDDGENMHT